MAPNREKRYENKRIKYINVLKKLNISKFTKIIKDI